MDQKQVQQKHKRLDFSYVEFEKKKKNLQNLELDKFFIFEQIGEGRYAQVYKGMNGLTNKEVAIKVLDIRIVEQEKNLETKRIRRRLIEQESKIMMKINSPHVLKCYECFSNRDLKIMIIEYCNQGTLGDKIILDKKIPEEEAISILKQILKGIGECHKQQIIHRDLKPDNILIHNGEIKIADFGFSKKLSVRSENEITKNTILGTPTTMAPQVLEKKPYGLKADIWSVGIIFFWMIFGICPFKIDDKPDKILNTMKKELEKSCEQFNGVKASEKVRKFFKEVLVMDVEKRLGWKEVLNHQIFTTQSKSLPNNFYRQVEIKKEDNELFDMEREFLYESRTILFDEKSQNLSQTGRQNKKSVSIADIQRVNQTENQSNVWSVLEDENSRESIRKNIFSNNQTQKLAKENQKSRKILENRSIERRQVSIREKKSQTRGQRQEDKNQEFDKTKTSLIMQKQQKIPALRQELKNSMNQENQELKTQEEQDVSQRKKLSFRSLRISNLPSDPARSTSKTRTSRMVRSPFHSRKISLYTSPSKKDIELKQPAKLSETQKFKASQKVKVQQKAQVRQKVQDSKKEQTYSNNKNRLVEVPSVKIFEKKNQINRQEDELYEWVRKIHVQCLKTEAIFNNIIQKIQNYKLLKIQDRKVVEMMHLLCTRCRNNMSPIYFEYKKRKHIKVLEEISGLVEKLYKQVTAKYYYYSDLLTNKENEKKAIVKDWFSKILFSEQFKEKDRLLIGIEDMAEFKPSNGLKTHYQETDKKKDGTLIDYTKKEQISFTSKYVKDNIKYLIDHDKTKQVYPYMVHFQEICQIKADDSTTQNFREKLEYILRDRNYLEENYC